jgi:mRNA-degrading endonuclease RelE of RelBE toxin-antitoxin system
MRRALRYGGRFVKELQRLDTATQSRIVAALERFAATGEGDVRPLHGEFAGSYRLRVGKWRVFVLLEGLELTAYQIDNRGQAY